MGDGPIGGTGAHAQKRVELENSTAGDVVTIPRQNMAAGNAMEQTLKREDAKSSLVQVSNGNKKVLSIENTVPGR